jgi:hypothetical protein
VPAARNATIAFGGPEPVSQRDAVRIFEEECGKPFTVTDIPQQALESQWSTAGDPFQKTFAALMLGVARGLGSDVREPPTEFGLSMTRPREFVQRAAKRAAVGA